jgi:hypothetical protein
MQPSRQHHTGIAKQVTIGATHLRQDHLCGVCRGERWPDAALAALGCTKRGRAARTGQQAPREGHTSIAPVKGAQAMRRWRQFFPRPSSAPPHRTRYVHTQRGGQRGLPLQVGDGPQAQLCALLHLLQAAAHVLPGLQACVAPPGCLCMDLLVQAVGGHDLGKLALGRRGAPWGPTLCAFLAGEGHKCEVGAAEEG